MKELSLLGKKVEDVVTGFTGIAESICFDLYGCIQVVIKGKVDDKGEIRDGRWFDLKRLRVLDDTPVLAVPHFVAVGGPADKPPMDRRG